jgi:hypothetical protein
MLVHFLSNTIELALIELFLQANFLLGINDSHKQTMNFASILPYKKSHFLNLTCLVEL